MFYLEFVGEGKRGHDGKEQILRRSLDRGNKAELILDTGTAEFIFGIVRNVKRITTCREPEPYRYIAPNVLIPSRAGRTRVNW
jgi:hypothetical protein